MPACVQIEQVLETKAGSGQRATALKTAFAGAATLATITPGLGKEEGTDALSRLPKTAKTLTLLFKAAERFRSASGEFSRVRASPPPALCSASLLVVPPPLAAALARTRNVLRACAGQGRPH